MSETPSAVQSADRSRPGVPLSPESWLRVKNLFWELQSLSTSERTSRLNAEVSDVAIRDYTIRLLSSSDKVGGRFDRPAIGMLGELSNFHDDESSQVPSLVGQTFGKYAITRRIGQGGMGAVYEAVRTDDAFEHRVAIKTLWRGADSSVLLQRFRSERQILANLEHPNIARLIDGGATESGTPYLVMELVDGIRIDQYCDDHRLGLTARLDLFRQVCAAVQHAHRNLVVHRDLKPSNVLVTGNATVKLLDFGVAKLLDDPRSEGTLTSAGLSPFTSAYAAPEQLSGAAVSTATDVFSLGALLFVLLAGRAPFEGDGSSAIPEMRRRRAVAPSSVTTDAAATARQYSGATRLSRALGGDLNAIVLAALRDEPARRYATVDALSEDVHRYLRGERVHARPDTLTYRARTFVRRRRALVGAVVVAVAALVAVSGIALWQARASRLEAARSEHIAHFLTLMTGAPDTRTGTALLRRGTRETITDMLDSALLRIPSAFPDDPRVRARLYTAIGTSYTAQSRMSAAATVLDSALYLSRVSYGPHSDEVAEASIDAAEAAMHRSPVRVARAYSQGAMAALRGRESQSPELYARALASMATTSYLAADLRATDSLARMAIATELKRTHAATLTRAWAMRLLAGTKLFRRNWRGADSLAARSVAIADSAGGTFSLERLDALFERSEVAMAIGNVKSADSLTRIALDAARRGYGFHSREAAIFLAQSSRLARLQTDTIASRALADTALSIIDSIPEVNSQVRIGVGIAALNELWIRKQFSAGDSLSHQFLAHAIAQEDPIAIATAAMFAGRARVYNRNLNGAEADFRRGLLACRNNPDMLPIAETLRLQLAVTVGTLGRSREADSLFATVPNVWADQGRLVLAGNLARAERH